MFILLFLGQDPHPVERCFFFLVNRHALDIREHYERKLERANNLYMELSAIMLQLEVREKELIKYVCLGRGEHGCTYACIQEIVLNLE